MSPAVGRAGKAETTRPVGPEWTVERLSGPVSELLDAPEPARGAPRLARLHTVERPGLVLGSGQPDSVADKAAAAAEGVEVVRRRSGGGAVLLQPGHQVWADFFVPADDPLWSDDVTEAALWAGELWASAVAPFAAEPVSVHTGRLKADRWGRLVCFAGQGPGEVFVGGLKVVGVSQRRNPRRARIQTTARLDDKPGAGAAEEAGPCLDELQFLDLAPDDRATGREGMARRCGVVRAAAEDLARSLLRALTS